MSFPNSISKNLVVVRCHGCQKILFEASADTRGTVIKKCDKCKVMRTISLPIQTKKANLPFVGTLVPA